MAVRISGIEPHRPSNRRKGYDRKVREMAPIFLAVQAKGYISAAHIAEALQSTTIRTGKGKPYSESVIYNMLRRAEELGIQVVRRSIQEAAWARQSKPRRSRRS